MTLKKLEILSKRPVFCPKFLFHKLFCWHFDDQLWVVSQNSKWEYKLNRKWFYDVVFKPYTLKKSISNERRWNSSCFQAIFLLQDRSNLSQASI